MDKTMIVTTKTSKNKKEIYHIERYACQYQINIKQ